MPDESEDPKVGYCRPPAATQFKPGKSGNPKGRPKGAKNFATALSEELNGTVAVTEGGKRRKLTRRQVIAKQLVNKAANGDAKVLPILFNETREHDKAAMAPPAALATRPEEKAVIEGLLDRLRRFDAARSTPSPVDSNEAGPVFPAANAGESGC